MAAPRSPHRRRPRDIRFSIANRKPSPVAAGRSLAK